jgi:amidase
MPGDPYFAPPPAEPFARQVDRDPGALRVGLMPTAPSGAPACHAECSGAVEEAGRLLESLGHHVEVEHPGAIDEHGEVQACFAVVVGSWTAKAVAQWGEAIGATLGEEDVEPNTWTLAEAGRSTTAVSYLAAVQRMHAWSRRVAQWWADGFDLLVTPTIAAPPPRIGELSAPGSAERVYALMSFTPQFNMTGQPAVSLPLAWSAAGLPIGVQLVADFAREDLLIRVAAQIERARPWSHRRPSLYA